MDLHLASAIVVVRSNIYPNEIRSASGRQYHKLNTEERPVDGFLPRTRTCDISGKSVARLLRV